MADRDLSPDRVIASLLEGKSRREMMVILARLEHGGKGSIKRSRRTNATRRRALPCLPARSARNRTPRCSRR